MALISKASLLMVPSTYEPGTLFNVLPSGNRAPDSTDQNSGYDQTRADFDFDRGSNAAASRINSSGLIEKYRENLLVQSNQFDTTWLIGGGGTGLTLTGGQADKDGGNTAWLIDEVTNDQAIYQVVSTSGVQTFSIYAKAGTNDWMRLGLGGGTFSHAYFDLVNGALGNTLNIIDSSIEDAGNGWWRCSVTANKSINAVYVYPSEANDSAGANGSIFIQSAQLESGLVATDYLESTSVTGKAGVLVDLPRINFDANGENGSLLLEPQRANLIQYSEYFGDSSWIKSSSVVVTSNASTSPEGVENASLVSFPSSTNRSLVYVVSGISSNTDYTFSLYIKKVSGSPSDTDLKMTIYGDVVSSVTNNIGSNISGEWQRFDVTATTNGSASSLNLQLRSEVLQSMYIFGAQFEAGSYPSSYIPTMGTAETRAADSCSVTGVSDVIGQTEGTLFAQVSEFPKENNGRVFAISDGTADTYITIIKNGANTNFAVYVDVSGVAQVSYTGSGTLANNSKIAVGYKNNDYAIYVNGTQVHTDASASVPACDEVHVGQRENGSVTFIAGGSLKQTALFNERLTNAELAALTA